jgi:lysophospholipid acyltransferase (LPLAT)-like uncharacterized protein
MAGEATRPGTGAGAPARTPREERRVRRLVHVGGGVLRALAATWRVRVVGGEHLQRLRQARQPFVFACWHGELLALLWHHRRQGVHVLVSEHRDGELVARVAEGLGFGTVRGSTTRGGGRALLRLSRLLQEGHEVAVTPDGPRGPARQYAPGALVAAQRGGAPVLLVSMAVDRAWRLRSWDRFVIPKPFARITVAYGEPAWVAGGTPREAAAETDRFTLLHEAVSRLAQASA